MPTESASPSPSPSDTTVDRGDDFTPTDDTPVVETPKAAEPAAPNAKLDAALEKPAAKETPDDKDAKGGETLVPRERFNEAVAKERAKTEAAAARAKELESQLAVQKVSEDVAGAQKLIKDMVKQRNSFLGDGELDKAGDLDERIMALQEAIAERKAEQKAESAKESAKEEMRYEAAVAKIERDHPQLDPEADEYDEESVAEVRALMRGYQAELRLSPSAALARAAKRVFNVPVKAVEAPAKGPDEAARRKAEATERNLDAAGKQPASPKDAGLDHDKKGGGLDAKTVIKLPYSEFIKIGDDVLAKMRGDTL